MRKIVSRVVITTAISFGILVTVFGSTSKDLKVYYDNIRISINGKELNNKASNNSDTEPFITNSVTFVPLRLISEALNCKVTWQSEEKKVLISTPDSVAVFGANGLYAANSEGGSIKLGDKITDEVFEWAFAMEDNSYIVLTQSIDDKPAILKRINNKGETLNIVLDVTKFKEIVHVNLNTADYLFRNGKVELTYEKQVGKSNIETYVYSVDTLSSNIEVIGFTPASSDNLGSFNGNIENYNNFIATKIETEQDMVNNYAKNK